MYVYVDGRKTILLSVGRTRSFFHRCLYLSTYKLTFCRIINVIVTVFYLMFVSVNFFSPFISLSLTLFTSHPPAFRRRIRFPFFLGRTWVYIQSMPSIDQCVLVPSSGRWGVDPYSPLVTHYQSSNN